MQSKDLILGIDTSNYTTSLAITDVNGTIAADKRKPLSVRQGERGLRQSHALFQHMENLPDMLVELFGLFDKDRIGAVSASNRPRPVPGSYMPVFKAGVNYGKIVAASLGVPLFGFSHQEGHLEAVIHNSALEEEAEYLAYHLSGGTTELLFVKKGTIEILGGSRDLSFGQVIDRAGVALGMDFPAGREMDCMAVQHRDKLSADPIITGSGSHKENRSEAGLLKAISIDGLEINLSGIETQFQRKLEKGASQEILVYELFLNISTCLCRLTESAVSKTGCSRILFTGGVAASSFLRDEIKNFLKDKSISVVFGDPALSSDNAVGAAFLGGKELWRSNR